MTPATAGKLLFISMLCTSVIAEEPEVQGGTGSGVGAENCSVYMTTYEHNPASVDEHHALGDEGVHHEASYTSSDYIHWLQGYLTAYDLYVDATGGPVSKASVGGMLYFIYRQCSKSPEAPFYSVLPALLDRIKNK